MLFLLILHQVFGPMRSLIRKPRRLIILVASAIALTSPLRADDKEPESASDAKPKTTKISGVLESTNAVEIIAATEQTDSLELKRIVPHGSKVGKEQNLVWFDSEEMDKKIKDGEIALKLSRLTLDGELFAHEQFLRTQALDKSAAERARKDAQQQYDNYVEVDRERQAKSAAFSLKSSRASLENAQEELHQLEQMYKEDDLTEESEEIVLKRAKQAVESAEFRFESSQIQNDRIVKQQIPKSSADQEAKLSRAELAYEKSMHELNSARQRHDVELAKKKEKFGEEEKDLAELKGERRHLVLTSPVEGIALHGKLNRGRLGDKPSLLKADSEVTASQVLLTVVDPNRLQIRVDLGEDKLAIARRGAKCKVTFKAFPDLKASGTVKSVSKVPYAATKYDCVVAIRGVKNHPELLPTMTCELEFAADGDQAASEE